MMAQSSPPLRNTDFLTLTICFLMTFLIATSFAESAPLATASNDDTICTGSPDWIAPGFSNEHCLEAAERLRYSDYAVYKNRRLEFSNRGTRRTTHFLQLKTPRRYSISTCTIFVAMLWDFPNQPPLPGAAYHPGPFEKNEITTFQEIYLTAAQAIQNCYGLPETPVGWQPVGEPGNIGVFFMATDSLEAQNFPATVYGEVGMLYLQNLTKTSGLTAFLP